MKSGGTFLVDDPEMTSLGAYLLDFFDININNNSVLSVSFI
jgi:hypothetical protein